MGFEPGEGVIPLLREPFEKQACLGKLAMVERPSLLAAQSGSRSQAGIGKHVKVLGDGLSRHFCSRGEFRDGQRLAPGKAHHELQARRVAERREKRR